MALQAGEGLFEIVVQAVDGVLLCRRLASEQGPLRDQLPQQAADRGVVGNPFGDDVRGAGQRLLDGGHALFLVYIIFCQFLRGRPGQRLGKERLGQGLQPLFLCHGGAGAAFGFIGAVQVLQGGQGLRRVDGLFQLFGELLLLGDGLFDSLLALLQAAQVAEAFLQRTQGRVVHGAVQLLAVTGDEGDGVPLVQKLDDVFDMAQGAIQLPGQQLADAFQIGLLCVLY